MAHLKHLVKEESLNGLTVLLKECGIYFVDLMNLSKLNYLCLV